MYRDGDPKKEMSQRLLTVYNKVKQEHKEQVEVRNVLTKGKKLDDEVQKVESKLNSYSYYNHENVKEQNYRMNKEYVKNVYQG